LCQGDFCTDHLDASSARSGFHAEDTAPASTCKIRDHRPREILGGNDLDRHYRLEETGSGAFEGLAESDRGRSPEARLGRGVLFVAGVEEAHQYVLEGISDKDAPRKGVRDAFACGSKERRRKDGSPIIPLGKR